MSEVVTCENVWKSYHLRKPLGVKALMVGRKTPAETRFSREWALHDVSFGVAKGQAFGVVGHNGSGKTTLLSVLLGTVGVDRGRVEVRGRVASLLELGAGFHTDLTGRENAVLLGSILGMRLEEIRRRFDAIVDFSGVARFLDTPIKRYSSIRRVMRGTTAASSTSAALRCSRAIPSASPIGSSRSTDGARSLRSSLIRA